MRNSSGRSQQSSSPACGAGVGLFAESKPNSTMSVASAAAKVERDMPSVDVSVLKATVNQLMMSHPDIMADAITESYSALYLAAKVG
ncbi:MAG: hypothetical protein P1U63_10820 [Coxiellaceae bacterium]|nr:hypothetical protein [Coxiellaceae bacterium]